jgi:hypothetical protein
VVARSSPGPREGRTRADLSANKFTMPYTVKITITQGSNLDYGTSVREVDLKIGLDQEDIFKCLAETLKKISKPE